MSGQATPGPGGGLTPRQQRRMARRPKTNAFTLPKRPRSSVYELLRRLGIPVRE